MDKRNELKRILKDIIVNEKHSIRLEQVIDIVEKYEIAYSTEYCDIVKEIGNELADEGYTVYWSVEDDCYYWIE